MLKIGIVLVTTTFFAGLLIAYPFAPVSGQKNAFRFAISTAQADEVQATAPTAQPDQPPQAKSKWAARKRTASSSVTGAPDAAPVDARTESVQPPLAQNVSCTTQQSARSSGNSQQDAIGCDPYPRRSEEYAARRSSDFEANQWPRPIPVSQYGQGQSYDDEYDSYRSTASPRYYTPRPVRAAPYHYTRYPSQHRYGSHNRYASYR